MKKLIAFTTLLISTFSWSQQEISIDIGDALVMKSLDISYEYYISDQSSVGVSALFNFEGKTSDFRYNEESMFTPFFRHYFTKNRTWNYFGEVFFGINNGENTIEVSGVQQIENYTDGALGISIGSKYVSNGGFTVSVLAGIGRNMFTDTAPVVVPRVGLNIGYNF
ncbi:DUF3575 domain-containing protein [Tenacibaculum sp. M341]|uniref:DUF3575 domain-containing protein n=1 Tax=Tenacibaculum sp. M341 TaxID=2530339 RepID=UPI001044D2EF|nr:DUF3575 domain-containing protein [Tenacibaculum sp. M341]TCI85884.1 DUF3575 domain-containing protein [Tenacibaculum sp. M341]